MWFIKRISAWRSAACAWASTRSITAKNSSLIAAFWRNSDCSSVISKALLDQLGRADQRARLRLGFSPFHLGHRVGDDASRGLHVQGLVLHDAGADRDRDVHVAGEAQVAAGAAVDAALDWLELVDDLHRADLRRAGQRARRESG